MASVENLQELIYGSRSPQDVTVVFDYWKTPWYFNNRNMIVDPNTCENIGKASNKEQFIQSQKLVSDSIRYEQQFLNSSNDVAVMIRIERMKAFLKNQTSTNAGAKWTYDSCLQEALKVTKEYLSSGLPMITLDVGTFGSKVIKGAEDMTEKSKLFLDRASDGKWTFEEWETSFTRAASSDVENSGYIAALQRTLASRAKCLVLAGGGNFQTLALWDYLRNHPNKEERCVHHVCAIYEDNLNRIVSTYT